MALGTGAVNNTGKHWTINGNGKGGSYIAYGTVNWINGKNDNGTSESIYLGTDGFSLG